MRLLHRLQNRRQTVQTRSKIARVQKAMKPGPPLLILIALAPSVHVGQSIQGKTVFSGQKLPAGQLFFVKGSGQKLPNPQFCMDVELSAQYIL